MALGLDYFRAIQNSIGATNQKEVKVAETQMRFAHDFDTSINVVYDATRNDAAQDFVIVPTKEKNKCNIYTRPGEEINIGDIIFWNKLHWLVIDKDFQDEIYSSGVIVRCNRIIRWQNPETLEIIKRWCLCTKPYTSNIEDGKIVSISNREYKIQLPYDEETSKVDLDRRFMLEKINGKPRTYKVTSVDSLTNRYEDIENNSGFLVWNLTQDTAGHENDNEDLWVCDYVEPEEPTPLPPPASPLQCTIAGRSELKIGGNSRTYQATFFQSGGVTEDTSVTAKWRLECDGLDRLFEVKPNGNSISIAALNSADLIGKTVSLFLSDVADLYPETKFEIRCEVI